MDDFETIYDDEYSLDPDEYEDTYDGYEDEEYYCPICGGRMKKYIEKGECRGTPYSVDLWECKNGC